MRLIAAVLFASVALSSSARAAEPEHPWSIGAGLGYSSGSSLASAQIIGLYTSTTVNAPGASITFERLLDTQTSLRFGVSGSFATRSDSTAGLAANSSALSGATAGGVAISLGLRRRLTEADALFGFSLHGALYAGVTRASQDITALDSNSVQTVTTTSASAWQVGATGGMAVDKSLGDRLSLRIAAELLNVGYAKGSGLPYSGTTVSSSSTFSASLTVSPSIELRLAF